MRNTCGWNERNAVCGIGKGVKWKKRKKGNWMMTVV
jgi:hypothetical protein